MAGFLGNPFATRHTRPGCLPPLDAAGRPLDMQLLLARALATRGAAIVGPHGSGKSNLLHHLALAAAAGGPVECVRLRSWRDLPEAWTAIRRVGRGGVACVDSWECVGPVERIVLIALARAVGVCLVVTAHHPSVLLATLLRCETTPRLLEAIVVRLVGPPQWGAVPIAAADVDAAFAGHGGDLREALYELYDRFESRRSDAARPPWRDGGEDRDDRGGGRSGIHESAARFSYAGAPERNLG